LRRRQPAVRTEQSDEHEERRADGTADDLRYDVTGDVAPFEPAGRGESERDGRIEVAARYRTPRVDARHDREAEGERDPEVPDSERRAFGADAGVRREEGGPEGSEDE